MIKNSIDFAGLSNDRRNLLNAVTYVTRPLNEQGHLFDVRDDISGKNEYILHVILKVSSLWCLNLRYEFIGEYKAPVLMLKM